MAAGATRGEKNEGGRVHGGGFYRVSPVIASDAIQTATPSSLRNGEAVVAGSAERASRRMKAPLVASPFETPRKRGSSG
jgi:hypothetical protein